MIQGWTGHRPPKLGGYKPCALHEKIKIAIEEDIKTKNPDKVVTGMALGVDQWVAEVCIKLGVPFVAALPYENHGSNWPYQSRQYHDYLLTKATKVIIVDQCFGKTYDYRTPGASFAVKLNRRDQFMCDWSDIYTGVWDTTPSGTANCLHYWNSLNKGSATIINPRTL